MTELTYFRTDLSTFSGSDQHTVNVKLDGRVVLEYFIEFSTNSVAGPDPVPF
jgi:hypothetical protein